MVAAVEGVNSSTSTAHRQERLEKLKRSGSGSCATQELDVETLPRPDGARDDSACAITFSIVSLPGSYGNLMPANPAATAGNVGVPYRSSTSKW